MTVRDMIAELAGNKCQCGKTKQAKQTFCSACFHALPVGLQRRLYLRIGSGYEAAYEAALSLLRGQEAA